jgi:dipeptidase E
MSHGQLNRDVRGLVMGSGSGLAEPGMAELVIELTGREASRLELLYLGTATYDAIEPRERQVVRFAELGVGIRSLDLATRDPAMSELEAAVAAADIVLVSGGNTLYAVDRWVALGLDRLLRDAVDRGLVLCGGSAGAICWFDGGHSDSMDPTSYRVPVPADDPSAGRWRYIRVAGLGVLPGLLCPHYGATQSNGILRAHDFAAMSQRHAGETAIGLDDWAGLLVDGETYRVVAPPGRPGSAGPDGFVADGSGRPGLWLLELKDGAVEVRTAPTRGLVGDILRPAREIVDDPAVPAARAQNPPPSGSR